jgi:hypothetical protein
VCAHLETCADCQAQALADDELTLLLGQTPQVEMGCGLITNMYSALESRISKKQQRGLWFYAGAMLFAILLLSWMSAQTWLAWQAWGADEYIQLIFSHPNLLTKYPAATLAALLETLPLLHITLTVLIVGAIVLLGRRMLRRWADLEKRWTTYEGGRFEVQIS